jgi:hypothetical protein
MFCKPNPRIEAEAHRFEPADHPECEHRVADDLRDRELRSHGASALAEHAAHRECERVRDDDRDHDDRDPAE